MSAPLSLRVALVLVCAFGLSSCSGAGADALRDIAAAVEGASRSEVGNAVPGELRVENDSEVAVCSLLLTDFDEPEAEGVELLPDGERLAPAASRIFPQGEHPLMDDHNLVVTAEGCDGEVFDSYAFTFIGHGGAYSIRHQVSS
ncbi:hypothetical protein B1759_05230 [Rubrivirga sp. SAORIC476]|uniref:hypothetical protein n=1 Tax=Rubrivirga sp. SAORIC476 TaxID=1961794 RepID=UPI000BA8ECC5|nr:hypothetical protein [Rubrivirga sp. SAORIC476]MAQ95397.1 hypothetical protein [Rhodothermaceae bacterium]PAP80777.1 hypothetical protein B1759_05230 [Rubrivirga sp. SAORIC476]